MTIRQERILISVLMCFFVIPVSMFIGVACVADVGNDSAAQDAVFAKLKATPARYQANEARALIDDVIVILMAVQHSNLGDDVSKLGAANSFNRMILARRALDRAIIFIEPEARNAANDMGDSRLILHDTLLALYDCAPNEKRLRNILEQLGNVDHLVAEFSVRSALLETGDNAEPKKMFDALKELAEEYRRKNGRDHLYHGMTRYLDSVDLNGDMILSRESSFNISVYDRLILGMNDNPMNRAVLWPKVIDYYLERIQEWEIAITRIK